jgi:Fe-S-cluster-containing dehydrogenase component
MIRTSDRRTVRLGGKPSSVLAELMFDYGIRAQISDPDLCLHCLQHQCLAVCPSSSLATREDGRVELDQTTCCGCAACVQVCQEFNNLALVSHSRAGSTQY